MHSRCSRERTHLEDVLPAIAYDAKVLSSAHGQPAVLIGREPDRRALEAGSDVHPGSGPLCHAEPELVPAGMLLMLQGHKMPDIGDQELEAVLGLLVFQ